MGASFATAIPFTTSWKHDLCIIKKSPQSWFNREQNQTRQSHLHDGTQTLQKLCTNSGLSNKKAA